MNATEAAIRAINSYAEFAMKHGTAEQVSQVLVQEAQAYAQIAQAEAMQSIAMHLGNIHQTLITPNADGEPVTAADQLKRIADILESVTDTTIDDGGRPSVVLRVDNNYNL